MFDAGTFPHTTRLIVDRDFVLNVAHALPAPEDMKRTRAFAPPAGEVALVLGLSETTPHHPPNGEGGRKLRRRAASGKKNVDP